MIYKDIGQRIRKLRRIKGVSQIELTHYIGYKSATAVTFIESGKRKINVATLIKIADYFDITIDELVGRKQQDKTRSEKTLNS